MGSTVSDLNLSENETLIAEWQPALRIFLRKLLLVAVLTTLALGGFGIGFTSNPVLWFASIPFAMCFYIFIFSDFAEWHRRRVDRWVLTDQRLLYRNVEDATEAAEVALTEITDVREWMTWALRITLTNGQTVVLKFLPDLTGTGATLRSALQAAKGQAND